MDNIRIGVAGMGHRGLYQATLLSRIEGYSVVALCESRPELLEEGRLAVPAPENGRDVAVFTDYDAFLASPQIDAVFLATRSQDQGALAAKALEAGKHVNSEVPAAHTLEDCWRIVLAQERSGKIYQLAEQVRYAGFVQEWRTLVKSGALGHITYAEGQYLHFIPDQLLQDPVSMAYVPWSQREDRQNAVPSWIFRMPAIHYIVHDLSPLLYILQDRVIEVVGMAAGLHEGDTPHDDRRSLQVALMKTAGGALLRMAAGFTQPFPEAETHWQQIIGTRGSVEWKRSAHDSPKQWFADLGGDKTDVPWSWLRPQDSEQAKASGHGGLDYHVHMAFRDAVLGTEPLEFDVYGAMDVAAPAIMAALSIDQGSRLLAVPQFRPGPLRPKGHEPQN